MSISEQKSLDEHIEVLKLKLLFLKAHEKPDSWMAISATKKELDDAIQRRMKLLTRSE